MTGIAAVVSVIVAVTWLQGLFGGELVALPLLLTLFANNVSTAAVSVLTARLTVSDTPTADEIKRKGVAAYVFTNAAGTIVALATHAMATYETRLTPDTNALTILLDIFRHTHDDTYRNVYVWLVVALLVPSVWLVYRGARLFAADKPMDESALRSVSRYATLLLALGIAISVPWRTVPETEQIIFGVTVSVRLALAVFAMLFASLYATLMARTVISILSALADQLVGLGQLLVREDFWSAFRLIGGAIILGVLYGVLFGIALVAVAWALLLLLEGFFPAEQVLAIIPETFNRLSVSLLSALVPTSVAAAAVLSVFGSLRFVAIRWGQLWGVARGLLAWIRRTLHRSFRRFRISVRRFVRGVRRFFRQSQREHRAAWRAAYVVTASALLLPVQWFLQFTAWLLVRVSNRRLAEFVSAAMLVVAVPALIDSTRYSERPLPPEAPPEIMTSEPPPSPSVERMVPLSIALCEPRIGGMEWALGRDDRLELPLTACALPP